ncbi:MAG: hypothetical protein Q8R55_02345 [Candidatus Taylorbacteria bacterium]|nr:hypothetical protein [Candidatus Taylorbacteria bacterium]
MTHKPRTIISLFVLSASLFVMGFVARGVTYINTPKNEIVVDFKTGQLFPVNEYIYVQNGSYDKIRYDATATNNSWMLVYREGNRNLSSVTMLGGNAVNFSVEIHPENLDPGLYSGTVTIKAVNPSTDNVLESKDVTITLKKDYVELPILSPTPSEEQNRGSSISQPNQESDLGEIGTTPADKGFISLSVLNLREGNVVSAPGSSDPDIYIVNDWGYKRLFLNPVIFGFYGHLGGFASVKNIISTTRDTLATSGLFRNCEVDDGRVYGLETTGEDMGLLHWINITGDQAVAQDPEFFKKVFCINNNEFNWYLKGSDYISVSQVPNYSR